MSIVKGTWEQGQIVLDDPVDWPEGCRVVIEPAMEERTLGLREDDWPTDAPGIAALVARMDQVEPFLTPAEHSKWQAAREQMREHTIANMNRQIEGIFE
jgi:hypothetical protein